MITYWQDIKTILNETSMSPELLELEITESMVMHNPERLLPILIKNKRDWGEAGY